MTHTNHRTCTACKDSKLIAEFRDRWGTVRAKCNDCRAALKRREPRVCSMCQRERPADKFNDAGRMRKTCHDCRAKANRRNEPGSDHDPEVLRALREWRRPCQYT